MLIVQVKVANRKLEAGNVEIEVLLIDFSSRSKRPVLAIVLFMTTYVHNATGDVLIMSSVTPHNTCDRFS